MRGNHVKTKYDLVRAFAPWAMVCSVTIWGYSYVVTKIALNVHTDPLILTAGCYIYGALGAAPLIFIKRHELFKKRCFDRSNGDGSRAFYIKMAAVYRMSIYDSREKCFYYGSVCGHCPILYETAF